MSDRRKRLRSAGAVAALALSLIVIPAGPARAGCATLESTWKDGLTGYWYATIYNPCPSAKQMRPVVPFAPDPCDWVGAYTRRTFTTGNQATGAADGC